MTFCSNVQASLHLGIIALQILRVPHDNITE